MEDILAEINWKEEQIKCHKLKNLIAGKAENSFSLIV